MPNVVSLMICISMVDLLIELVTGLPVTVLNLFVIISVIVFAELGALI